MLKRVLIKFIITGLALAACIFSILRLQTLSEFSDFKLSQKADSRRVKSLLNSETNSEELIVKELELFVKDPFSSFKELSEVAIRYSEIAEKHKDTEQKITYLCKTLGALRASLSKDPLHARSLVTWASVKQLLGSYRCLDDNSLGFEGALELAQQSDPLDQQALFNAGLVYLWANQKEKAHILFRRVLDLGTDSSTLQREFIYSLIIDVKDLNNLIPARIPQALEFLLFALSQSSESPISSLPKSAIAEFQIQAIREFAGRFDNSEIDDELYHDRLLELWKVSRESVVTSLLDRLLGDFYRKSGREETGSFFSSRSHLAELEIVPALRKADSRPEKSALSNWSYTGEVLLDEFFSSIGFYLPREKTLRRIELHSSQRNNPQIVGLIRILQSDDNTTWEDVTGVCSSYQVIVAGQSIVYLELPGSTKRFWKLHYASPARNHQFRGALPNMIRAFGVGALGN